MTIETLKPLYEALGIEPSGGRPKVKKQIDFDRLNDLLDHFVLLYGTDTVWDTRARKIIKVNALRLAVGHDYVKLWLAHEKRRMIPLENLVFEPGAALGENYINLYAGFAVEPVAATRDDVEPMLDLLLHLCSHSGSDKHSVGDVVQWVLRWIAYPLQHPGAKMATAMAFFGRQGSGKNLFFDALRDLYGPYGVMVSQTELEDKFNAWLSGKTLIIGDEVVSRQELYHHKNKLKWLVTQRDKVPIRAQFQDVRWETNHANIVLLSNESQPLALEDGDRRYMCVYTPETPAGDLIDAAVAFLSRPDGPSRWLGYLLSIDLGTFTEHTKPIYTHARNELIELGRKPAERFAGEWVGGMLETPVHPCSVEQLYREFSRWCDRTGERFRPTQAQFTSGVNRYFTELVEPDERGVRRRPLVACKVVSLPHPQGGRKSVRCWIPRGSGPINGKSEGEWVAQCVADWERERGSRGRFGDEVD